MKAIIMAGGEGSRLRPLTCDCPKPMLQLLGRPLMEHALRLLKTHGINEVGATLGYLPDAITDYFGDGESFGARLHYYIEKTPLGTAGSVKRAGDFLDGRFIVLSGDGITDIDLAAALRFHRDRGALATLILKKSAHPEEYGMVVTEPDGRIRSFHEKPGRSDVYSDLVNTGIYILEREILDFIPEDRPYDFGHDLFPLLVQRGAAVFGWVAEGYWCDVGDVGAYLRVHADALRGRIRLPGLEPRTEGAILESGCSVEEPVWIAPGAHICSGARIGAGSVIGAGCFIAPGASLKQSILFPGARVELNAQLRGCIVGSGAVVGEGAQLFEESAVGSTSRVGERATLSPGVKLWPGKFLPGGEKPEANIVWGSRREQRFIGGSLQLESPAQASRAAEACMAGLKPRELILGRAGSSVAGAIWHAAAAGAMAQGAQVVDAGVCTLPQLRHIQSALHGDCAMLAEAGGLLPLTRLGARLAERSQRSILKLLERQDFSGPFSGITRPVISAGPADLPYAADAAAMFEADPACAPGILLGGADPLLMESARRSCIRAGLRVRCEPDPERMLPGSGEMGIVLCERGERAILSDEHGPLDEVQRQLACAWTALELGEGRLILPIHATRAIDELARRYGAHAVYLPGEVALWMNAAAERAPMQFRLNIDGLAFALRFISLLTDRGLSLDQWRRRMPAACRSTRQLQVPFSQSGRLLHALAEAAPEAELGGGVRLPRRNGWAWLSPDDAGSALELFAEAPDMEAARELCDFYDGEIRRLLSQKRD